MFNLLSTFDPNEDFTAGEAAARDAGLIEQVLYDAIPFGSDGFKAGYEKGWADRNNG